MSKTDHSPSLQKRTSFLFRKCLIYDNAIEEIPAVQLSTPTTKVVIQDVRTENMETEECEFLENLYVSCRKIHDGI